MPKGDVFTKGLREGTESKEGGTDIKKGHQTQVYPDDYRASRNEYGPWHWTNQNVPKDHPDRHKPPRDAR